MNGFTLNGKIKWKLEIVSLFVGIVLIVLNFLFFYHKNLWERLWSDYFAANWFFLTVFISLPVFIAIQSVINSKWSKEMNINFKRATHFFPILSLTILIIFIGINDFMHFPDQISWFGKIWFHPVFVIIRAAIIVLLINYLVSRFYKRGITGNDHKMLKKESQIFLLTLLVLSIFISNDWILPLHANWHSSMFPVYLIVNFIQVGAALIALFSYYQPDWSKEFRNDLGKYLRAVSFVWFYIFFSMLLITWYSGIDEGIAIYSTMFSGSSLIVFIVMVLSGFILPFFILMSRKGRIFKNRLFISGILVLSGKFPELWLFSKSSGYHGVILMDIGFWLILLGVFALYVKHVKPILINLARTP